MQLVIFIFVGILIFILVGVVRALLYANRLRRAVRDMFTGGAGNPADDERGNSYRRSRRREQAKSVPTKKIGRDVGEYIEFEEVAVKQTVADAATGRRSERVRVEQQVTDVEWEDL